MTSDEATVLGIGYDQGSGWGVSAWPSRVLQRKTKQGCKDVRGVIEVGGRYITCTGVVIVDASSWASPELQASVNKTLERHSNRNMHFDRLLPTLEVAQQMETHLKPCFNRRSESIGTNRMEHYWLPQQIAAKDWSRKRTGWMPSMSIRNFGELRRKEVWDPLNLFARVERPERTGTKMASVQRKLKNKSYR